MAMGCIANASVPGAARRGPRRRQQGISLLEMTLVVFIIGALAAAVLPGLAADDPQRLQLAANEAAAALRFARGEALRTGSPHGVRLRPSPPALEVFRLDTAGSTPVEIFDVRHPLTRYLYRLALDTAPFAPGTILQADFRFSAGGAAQAAVAFDHRGEPVSPLDLAPLHQPGHLQAARRGLAIAVSLDTVTGRVSRQ